MGLKETVVASPSFPRFILWETLGIVGFLHILQYAPPNDSTPLFFLANAVIFIAAFPTLYFYNQLKLPTFLKLFISPLGMVLRVVLLACCYFWVTYVFYASNFTLGEVSCFQIFKDYWYFLGPFFVFDYFSMVEHLWGLSKVNFSFWTSLAVVSDGVSGVVTGFYLGRTLNTKWGMFFGDESTRALIWTIFILIGIAAISWFGNKTRKG
jgi:hypothetical protein